MTCYLTGHYRTESGSLERGRLGVVKKDGKFRDMWTGGVLTARSVNRRGLMIVEISCSDANYEFLPDGGECQRAGMEVTVVGAPAGEAL